MLVEVELNALSVKVVDGGDKLLKRAPEAADAPYGDQIEITLRRRRQHRIESWTLVSSLGSADTIVSISSDHIPATKSGDTLKFMELVVSGLVGGGYSDVQGGFGLVHRWAPLNKKYLENTQRRKPLIYKVVY